MNQSSNPNTGSSAVQISNAAEHHLASPNAGQASVLANASDVRIKDSNFSITTNITTAILSTLHELYQRVAPNAILNDGGRADDAKCFPGTREEVIGLIEKWADAADSSRILWLSGPAGGGKTAIMKTITERAADRGVHTINFYFFRGDSTRQSIRPVVPTILYQFFEHYPNSANAVADIMSTRPRILDGSIAQQCKLVSALVPIIRQSLPPDTPIVLLVDGLDECDVDAERSQGDILRALEGLMMEADSPFRLLLASRPEARIKMAFNQLSLRVHGIFLDEQYRPEDDIRRFVVAEFNRIKACHPSAHLLPPNWPSPSDVKEIAMKSSGQFIFAATVMRYIAHASTVPSLSLERVKGIEPSVNNSPFKHLDSIYIFILLRVDSLLDAVLAMFFLKILYDEYSKVQWLREYNSHYTLALVESCISELSAIVNLTAKGTITFYHASLPDFLLDKARSGKYWVDINAYRIKVLIGIWSKSAIVLHAENDHYNCLQYDLLQQLDSPTKETTDEFLKLPLPGWISCDGFIRSKALARLDFFLEMERLYYGKHEEIYEALIYQCVPLWAQFLARKVQQSNDEDSGNSFEVQYKEYLEYLSRGGVVEWASTVEKTRIMQCRITHILEEPTISLPDIPDGPGATFLEYQQTHQKNSRSAVHGKIMDSPTEISTPTSTSPSVSSGEGSVFVPEPTFTVVTSTIPRRSVDKRKSPLVVVPPDISQQDDVRIISASPTEYSVHFEAASSLASSQVISTPRASPTSLPRISPVSRASGVNQSSGVKHITIPLMKPNSVLQFIRSTQQPKAPGSGTITHAAFGRNQVSSVAQVSTRPWHTLQTGERQPSPVRREHTEAPKAVSRSAATMNTRGLGMSKGVAPPKAPAGAMKQRMPSDSGFPRISTTHTPWSVHGKSQHPVPRASDDKSAGGRGPTGSRGAVVKESTRADPAPQSSSKILSPIPPSRSSNTRENRKVNARGVIAAAESGRGGSNSAWPTERGLRNAALPKASASGDAERRTAPLSGKVLQASTKSIPAGARDGKRRSGAHHQDGDEADRDDSDQDEPTAVSQAAGTKDSTTAGSATRVDSISRSTEPPARSSQPINTRTTRGSTKPSARPVWRG